MPGISASEELPRNIEPEIPVVVREPAARQLAHGGPEAVGDVELEGVAAGAFLDAERPVRDAGVEARYAGNDFPDDVHRGTHTQPGPEANHYGVVVVNELVRGGVAVVDPDRLDVHRAKPPERARDRHPERGRIAVAKIIGAVDRREHADRDGRPVLLEQVVLTAELDGLVA